MLISAVVVSYRSAALAAEAIAGLRREARGSGVSLEAIAVVNSGDPEEAGALRQAADIVDLPGRNLGFAGGLNRGAALSRGDILVLANPDVVFLPSSLATLLAALDGAPGLAAAGPAYLWDDAGTLQLPPAEEPRPAELLRRAAERTPERRRALFARSVRRAVCEAERMARGETFAVSALWGAVMAMTPRTLAVVGPFDEGYALYYEEHDWQRRLRAMKGTLLRAGGSRVVHRFNQSAGTEPRAREWFAASERRYFISHFGERGRKALARLEATPGAGEPEPPGAERLEWRSDASAAVAVSPFPWFRPFAYASVAPGERSWALPEDVRRTLHGPFYARVFDRESLQTLAEARISG